MLQNVARHKPGQRRCYQTTSRGIAAPRAARGPSHNGRNSTLIVAAVATASLYYFASNDLLLRPAHAESPEQDTGPRFERTKRRNGGASQEDFRDLISSQHLQVKRSWENPGVYTWGSNEGRVTAPDSDEAFVKTPRRLPFFDGKLLRDLKLDKTFGAAIDERGNLLQWGTAYSKESRLPAVTLRGKDLVSMDISRDRILGLSSSGKVYSIPVSEASQQSGNKPSEASWIPFWSGKAQISYRILSPENLSWNERVTAIASGEDHALLLTSKGRLFSAASASESYPTRGQLGIPGLTWLTKPTGPYDKPHEITTLRGFEINKIACGQNHSLVADTGGRIFAFGDNSAGQLGFEYSSESSMVDTPALLPIQRLYPSSSGQVPTVTGIAAGGNNSYLTIDATKTPRLGTLDSDTPVRGLGRTIADTWAFGAGIYGTLGNGRWTHVQGTPTKIPLLSGLFEYDEQRNVTIPIRLAHLSVGAAHVAAVMDNVTYLDASTRGSDAETNWGADIVFFGANEQFQLGTGKRNNVNVPTYIKPLDAAAEVARSKGTREEHRFQITPRKTVRLGDGRTVSVEQRVECGRGCTAVYSRA